MEKLQEKLLLDAIEASKKMTECLMALAGGSEERAKPSLDQVYENTEVQKDREVTERFVENQQMIASSLEYDEYLSADTEICRPAFKPPSSAVPTGMLHKSQIDPDFIGLDSDAEGAKVSLKNDPHVYKLTRRLNRKQCLAEMFSEDGKASTLKVVVLNETDVCEDHRQAFQSFQMNG